MLSLRKTEACPKRSPSRSFISRKSVSRSFPIFADLFRSCSQQHCEYRLTALQVCGLVNVINVHMILAPVIICFYANFTTVAWELSRLLNAQLVAVLGIGRIILLDLKLLYTYSHKSVALVLVIYLYYTLFFRFNCTKSDTVYP